MAGSVKPKWKEGSAVRRGIEAHHLAVTYQSVLEPRLAAGAIDGLSADVALLTGSGADRQVTKTAQKGQTKVERELAENAKDWVIMTRRMAKRTRGIGSGVLKSLGVGEEVRSDNTSQVVGAVNACFRVFDADPELPRRIGLVEDDLTEARNLVVSLLSADADQTEVMTESKDKTFDRDAVQLRIEAAVDMISSRGEMAFRAESDIRARFRALVTAAGPSSKSETGAEVPAEE